MFDSIAVAVVDLGTRMLLRVLLAHAYNDCIAYADRRGVRLVGFLSSAEQSHQTSRRRTGIGTLA